MKRKEIFALGVRDFYKVIRPSRKVTDRCYSTADSRVMFASYRMLPEV